MLNDNRKMFNAETGGIKLTKCEVYLWQRNWETEKQNSLCSFSSGQKGYGLDSRCFWHLFAGPEAATFVVIAVSSPAIACFKVKKWFQQNEQNDTLCDLLFLCSLVEIIQITDIPQKCTSPRSLIMWDCNLTQKL